MGVRKAGRQYLNTYEDFPLTYDRIAISMRKQGLITFDMEEDIAKAIEFENRC